MSITGKLFRILMVDRTAKKKDLDQLTGELRTSDQTIANIVNSAEDNEANREQLCHVIGIERWAQMRLQTALGGPVQMDEYDGYRPDLTQPLPALADTFSATREQTLTLADKLLSQPNIADKIVAHNDMGDMRVKSWLQYIEMHGPYELRNVQ
ncbi:MAG: hypothetical protein AAF614_39905 [Chloroflexota bacterium]